MPFSLCTAVIRAATMSVDEVAALTSRATGPGGAARRGGRRPLVVDLSDLTAAEVASVLRAVAAELPAADLVVHVVLPDRTAMPAEAVLVPRAWRWHASLPEAVSASRVTLGYAAVS
ncbi:hypothetical protein [Kineosporia sp. A_224]|uniref:hypothetical protein n=1 Tax=Kineosporia sp. A_224 TaxID=1962180 RepID=UPI00117A26D3|nr:hypothetical protein [Kineosporia sp. A_224]